MSRFALESVSFVYQDKMELILDSYSIMAVKQDDFSDVELPEEVKARDSTPGVSES